MGMIRQVFLYTLAAVAASVLITLVLMTWLFPGTERLVVALSIATIVPLFVAAPTTWYVCAQREKVSRLHDRLQAAHEELKGLHQEAEHRASIDRMTGLLNRESFMVKTKFRRRRTDQGFLLLVDIDGFKEVNDTYGHQAGDTALLETVKVLNAQIRGTDLLGRIGGDEFALFLSDMSPEKAWNMAEDIRDQVEHMSFRPRPQIVHKLTVSIGIAPAPQRERMIDIMEHADQSLYAAKRAGRNRVAFRPREEDQVGEISYSQAS